MWIPVFAVFSESAVSKTHGFVEACRKVSEGTTNRVRMKEDRFYQLQISLPPLAEQRRIVAKIDHLAAKIEEAWGLREQSDNEILSYQSSVCRLLFNNHHRQFASIEDRVGRKNLKNGKSVKSIDAANGTRCLRLSAISNGKIDLSDSKPVPLTHKEATPYMIAESDVFVMRGNGSKHLVGQAALARKADGVTIFPDLLIRVPLSDSGWSPEFFVAYWNSPIMRQKIEDTAKTTSGIWKINQGHIAAMALPVISRVEQSRIVAHLDSLQARVDELKQLQEKTAAELDALLPSILGRAFKGEL